MAKKKWFKNPEKCFKTSNKFRTPSVAGDMKKESIRLATRPTNIKKNLPENASNAEPAVDQRRQETRKMTNSNSSEGGRKTSTRKEKRNMKAKQIPIINKTKIFFLYFKLPNASTQ